MTPILNAKNIPFLHIRPGDESYEMLRTKLQELIDYYEAKQYAYELQVQKTIFDIWLILLEMVRDKTDVKNAPVSAYDQERIETAISYISENCTQRITLKDIARQLNCSSEECCRLFKRTIQQSPIRF